MTAVAAPTFVYPEDIDSATTKSECRKLWELATGQLCVEFGAWKGRTTVTMGQSAETVHAIDHFHGDMQTGYAFTLIEYLKNLQRYGMDETVVTHIGRFRDVVRVLQPASFGLVFCDGLHTREATELQAEWAAHLVAADGTIAFHDYGRVLDDFHVTEVVNERFGRPDELVDTLAIVNLGGRDMYDGLIVSHDDDDGRLR